MGILSRVFKSFDRYGYTPTDAENSALSKVRLGDISDDTLGGKLKKTRADIVRVKRDTVRSWNMYPPTPESLGEGTMPTYWGEGKPQTLSYHDLGRILHSVCADIRRYLWGGRKNPNRKGSDYLCRYWEGSLMRLFSDQETAWAEIFNDGFAYCLGLAQTNAERALQGKKPLAVCKSGIVRHLVSTTYRGTNPKGHLWYFGRLDGEWFGANRPFIKVKSKTDAESLISRGYLWGWDKKSGQEIRIPIRCVMVISLDVQHMADPRSERVRLSEMLHKVSESDTLTTDERLVCIAVARNPNATRTEIARILGKDNEGPTKGRDWVNNRCKEIRSKVPSVVEDMMLAD